MARKSVLPELLELLEAYIDKCAAEWEGVPSFQRKPTLPTTRDGKVNVRRLVKELGLRSSQEQHFFNKKELKDLINLEAENQGILPIGSRALDDEAAEAVKGRLSRMSSMNKKANEELVEALRQVDRLTEEKRSLQLEVERLKAQINSIYTSGDIAFRGDQ
ncbi:MAG: hypothetical protein ABJG14_19340 [Sulfitobacter sp.]|jgi:chromosome segregation ATPase|uniref:hypothetical protein n=3 Tax=Pseudomonadota TaxID=1224 RepID=UPI0032676FD9